jgi:hypothetical protein
VTVRAIACDATMTPDRRLDALIVLLAGPARPRDNTGSRTRRHARVIAVAGLRVLVARAALARPWTSPI